MECSQHFDEHVTFLLGRRAVPFGGFAQELGRATNILGRPSEFLVELASHLHVLTRIFRRGASAFGAGAGSLGRPPHRLGVFAEFLAGDAQLFGKLPFFLGDLALGFALVAFVARGCGGRRAASGVSIGCRVGHIAISGSTERSF